MRGFHILLVDDDDLAVLNMQRAIDRAGFAATITAVADGTEALRLLRDGSLPEERVLVLTDLNMPGMSGLAMLAQIRSDPVLADLPVVILTASTLAADRASAFNLHAAGFFVKPEGPTRYRDVIGWLCNYWASSEFGHRGALDGP